MKSKIFSAVAAATMLALTGTAHATLIDRGNGTVYDDVADVTWLQNWNSAGKMSFTAAQTWAENLTQAGSSDWALPTIDQYYTLASHISGGYVTSSTLFSNVPATSEYWSTTPFDSNNVKTYYPVINGWGAASVTGWNAYTMAVHSGDVAVLSVPEPETYAMMLAGLGALGFMSRRRRVI